MGTQAFNRVAFHHVWGVGMGEVEMLVLPQPLRVSSDDLNA
jgi:hypothetical protein